MASGADDFTTDRLTLDWAVQTNQSTGTVSGGGWNAADIFFPCGHRRTAESYTGDHYSRATLLAAGIDRDYEVRVRCQDAAESYYAGGMEDNALGSLHYRIWKVVAGVATNLVLHASQDPATNDVVELRMVGTTLTLLVNTIQILSTTDAALSGGAPGFGAYSPTNPQPRWDNWSAADIGGASDTPRTPTVGSAAVTGNAPGRVVGVVLTPQTP